MRAANDQIVQEVELWEFFFSTGSHEDTLQSLDCDFLVAVVIFELDRCKRYVLYSGPLWVF